MKEIKILISFNFLKGVLMTIVPKKYKYYDYCLCYKNKNIIVGNDECFNCKHMIRNDIENFVIYCHIYYNKDKKKHYFINYKEVKK